MTTPPTWEQYTAMQFKLEREIATLKADVNKWKYHVRILKDQRSRIDWLEKELEKKNASI